MDTVARSGERLDTNVALLSCEDINYLVEIGDDFFSSNSDESQVSMTMENLESLLNLEKDAVAVFKQGNGSIVGFSVMFPTARAWADQFLNKEINEKKLFDLSVRSPAFDSIYIMAILGPVNTNQSICDECKMYKKHEHDIQLVEP